MKGKETERMIPEGVVVRVLAGTLLQDMTKAEAVRVIYALEKFALGGRIPFVTEPGTPERKARTIMSVLKNLSIRNAANFITEAKKIYCR